MDTEQKSKAILSKSDNEEKVMKKMLNFVPIFLILLHAIISWVYNLKLYNHEILYVKAILVPFSFYLLSSFFVISYYYKNDIKIKFVTIISSIESASFFITWMIVFYS